MNNQRGGIIAFLAIAIVLLLVVASAIIGLDLYTSLIDSEEVVQTIQGFGKTIIDEVSNNANTTNEASSTDYSSWANEIESTNQNTNTKTPTNIYSSSTSQGYSYFYNQLNEYSKIIYNGLVSNINNLKTGTYELNFGGSFQNLLLEENGQEILGDYYQSAIEAFSYDNPEVFFLNVNKMYLNIKKTTQGNKITYEVYVNSGKEPNYLADGFTSKEQIEEVESQLEGMKNKIISNVGLSSAYNKILYVHDYLINNVEYEETFKKNNIYNIVGALIEGESVCEGYAKAYKYLLDALEINSVIVVGTGTNSNSETESHAWNYVELNDTWYAVDTTWDDPIIKGGGTIGYSTKHRYFLKGLNTMNKDHVPSGKFTQDGMIFIYPTVSNTNYR